MSVDKKFGTGKEIQLPSYSTNAHLTVCALNRLRIGELLSTGGEAYVAVDVSAYAGNTTPPPSTASSK